MKIRFSALILLLLFSLSSCHSSPSITTELKVVKVNSGIYYNDLIMSAEIQTKQVKKGDPFEIEVGFGQLFDTFVYSEATLIIKAPDLKIILLDGTSFENTYERKIMDFSEDKYGYDGETMMPYQIESFRFVYIGAEEEHTGSILFWITRLLPERNDGMPGRQAINMYYKVSEDHITLTTTRPK
ncbi:MAG: hypothetical protein J6K14_06420 [Clostridia bacterium]|nr:hypothetical protein [Clostridia bacterium]